MRERWCSCTPNCKFDVKHEHLALGGEVDRGHLHSSLVLAREFSCNVKRVVLLQGIKLMYRYRSKDGKDSLASGSFTRYMPQPWLTDLCSHR